MDVYCFLKDKFKLNAREDYRNCRLSNSTKKILCDIGLPYEPLNYVRFNIDKIDSTFEDEEYIAIGSDLGTDICINYKDEVVSVDRENEYPIRFINRSLESFLEFIVIIIKYEDELKESDDDEIIKVMQKIRKEFDEIDIQALSSDENWWSIILEQLELGVM